MGILNRVLHLDEMFAWRDLLMLETIVSGTSTANADLADHPLRTGRGCVRDGDGRSAVCYWI